LLAPTLAVYNAAGTTRLGQQISYTMGDTISLAISNVAPGQVYTIRASGTGTGDSGFGAYGLQVNFGSLSQPPVTAPDTYMAEASNQGGGTMSESSEATGDEASIQQDWSAIPGVPTFWVYDEEGATISEDAGMIGWTETDEPSEEDPLADPTIVIDTDVPEDSELITVGDMSGLGCAFMMPGHDHDPDRSGGLAPWAPRWQPPRPVGLFMSAPQARPVATTGLAAMDFFSGSDRKIILPFFSTSSTRRTARMQQTIVDRALADLATAVR
jgi:hypothetical protein